VADRKVTDDALAKEVGRCVRLYRAHKLVKGTLELLGLQVDRAL
jgi:hypothetical protein